jgi:hypothetical protein
VVEVTCAALRFLGCIFVPFATMTRAFGRSGARLRTDCSPPPSGSCQMCTVRPSRCSANEVRGPRSDPSITSALPPDLAHETHATHGSDRLRFSWVRPFFA